MPILQAKLIMTARPNLAWDERGRAVERSFMAKKLPLLISTLTALASLGFQVPANAIMDFEEERPPEWSAIELLNHADVVYRRIIDACRGVGITQTCLTNQVNSIMTENNKDSAFLYLRKQRTIIPSIDYTNGAVKFIYFDSDVVSRLQGTANPEPILNAYVGWMNSPRGNYYNVDFSYLYNGRMDQTQRIAVSLGGANKDFTYTNQIVELKDQNYTDENNFDTIAYSIVGTRGSIFHRQYYFGGCIDEEYEPGMICRAMINGKGELIYRHYSGTESLQKPINEDYSLYNAGYEAGLANSQNDGYDAGYSAGQQNGYEIGYEQGYNDGQQDSYDIGYDDGHDAGEQYGYDVGHSEGFEEGYNQGYANGSSDGADAGYQSGHLAGYSDGFDAGYQSGYTDGYEAGLAQGNADITPQENIELDTSDVTDQTSIDEISTRAQSHVNLDNSSVELVSTLTSSTNTMRHPDTGEYTVDDKEGTTESAWWIGAIFALGLVTVCWLFWPNRQKSKKSPKKF